MSRMKMLVFSAALLLWPAMAAGIVFVRFSLIPSENRKIDVMQKWGGDY